MSAERERRASGGASGAETRRYRMRKRQEDIDRTRQRIVEAAVELHGSVGPAHTTYSAVADLAGVQRSTVYRHFSDEEALFNACTSHWFASHPWPTGLARDASTDPHEHLHRSLRELYGYFDANQQMLGNAYRDIEVMPAFVGELMRAQSGAMHSSLMESWPANADRARLAAAVSLAIDFRTWQALDGGKLDPESAAELMADMVASVA